MAYKMSVNKLHSEERKKPYKTPNRTTTRYKNWVKNDQREKKKHSDPKEPLKSGQKKKKKKKKQSH